MKKIILCDWVDVVDQYNIPATLKKKLLEKGKEFNIEFIFKNSFNSSDYCKMPFAYIGNRPEKLITSLPSIKWIHFGSVGTDRIDVKEFKSKGGLVSNAKNIFDDAVSTTALSFALSYLIPRNKNFDADSFSRQYWEKNVQKISGTQIIVLGHGCISQKLCEKLNNLGLGVMALTRSPKKYIKSNYKVLSLSELELLKQYSNKIIINLLPSKEQTIGFVNSKFFQCVGDIFAYINIGRIDTENEESVLVALQKNYLQYAHWDVIRSYEKMSSYKVKFDNRVSFTPHISSFSINHWEKTIDLVINNLNALNNYGNFKFRNDVDE